MTKELEQKIRDIVHQTSYPNEDGGIEIYCDYHDEISDSSIKKIMNSDNPKIALQEWFDDVTLDSSLYYLDEIYKALAKELEDEYLENESEIDDYVQEHYYCYLSEEHFNRNVNVNLMVDCGNWNTDCVEDNVLNWYGTCGGYGNNGNISNLSSMLWLAKTQGKATKLRAACKKVFRDDGDYVNREVDKDKFIESCIQEFENLPSHMATVTFLLKMPLFDVIDLLEKVNSIISDKYRYNPQDNPNKSYMIIGKETECGLYDPWSGGGSVLAINLDKDVKLPLKYARVTVDGCKTYGYDVNEVYGLIDSCWKESVKEICA